MRQKISASKYKAPVSKFDDAWAVAVLNCTKDEADAILVYSGFLQRKRVPKGAAENYVTGTGRQYVKPMGRTPTAADYVKPMRLTPNTSPLLDEWTIEWNTETMRQELTDPNGKRYYDDNGMLVEITRVPRCSNGHALDYGNQICNICGERMPLRESEIGWKKAPDDDVFGDADLIKQREARQDEFDRQRKEQQRIESVDPTGRFSGLELD